MSNRQNQQNGQKAGARQPTALDRQIGVLIRERRAVKKMRQEDLARLLGITPHQLQKYEVGENRIAASRLVECARALGVPVVWFYQASGSQVHAPVRRTPSLTASENELIESYRKLSATERAQLLSFAKVMQNSGAGTKIKARGA